MDILFKDPKMAKFFNSSKELVKTHGPERAKKIRLRLDQLSNAIHLKEYLSLQPRCHVLTGDLKGIWSSDLDKQYRLLFEVADDPIPIDSYNQLDLGKVKSVRIIDVTDTHTP